MSDMGEMWKEARQDQKDRRAKRLPIRTQQILDLQKLGYKVVQLTEYQFRVNDEYDLYPTHNRWHWLKRNVRGGAKNLSEFVKKAIKPIGEHNGNQNIKIKP